MGIVTLPIASNNTGPNLWSDVYNNDAAIVDQVNGDLDATNLAANVIGPNELTSALAEDLGVDQTSNVRRGVTSIATEQTTTSTTYTTLTTPDQVASVVLPANGLLFVNYRALWKLTGASNAGAAAIFVGSNQLKQNPLADSAPAVSEASLAATGDNYGLLTASANAALTTTTSPNSDSSFVTTGMIMTSPTVIVAAAGTYTISIQFHVNATNGGTLTVKERNLWVKAEGF